MTICYSMVSAKLKRKSAVQSEGGKESYSWRILQDDFDLFLQQDGRRPGLIQLAIRPQASPSDSLTPDGRGGRLHRDSESVGANSPETGKCPVPQCKRKAALQRKLDGCELLRRKWQEIHPGE